MSSAALLQFYYRVQADPALEAEVSQSLDHDLPAVVAIGAREGFAFTEDELKEGLGDLAERRKNELSDDDLDLVTGGSSAPLNNVETTGSAKS